MEIPADNWELSVCAMSPLDIVRLTPLVKRSRGRPEVSIGLIDGPIYLTHPDLTDQKYPGSAVRSSGRKSPVGFDSRILTQLNRGEDRHKLARAVFHSKRGQLRQRYREGQEDQLGALDLMLLPGLFLAYAVGTAFFMADADTAQEILTRLWSRTSRPDKC
jgi:hypothetical protein